MSKLTDSLLSRIKSTINNIIPDAKIILFGSNARGEGKEESDIDLLVILNQDKISREREKQILQPLYALEFETGKMISPIVTTADEWEKASHRTTFYHEVMKEGIVL